ILVSDVVKDYSRTLMLQLGSKPPLGSIRQQFAVLEQRARREFRAERWRGALLLQRTADLRYQGQGYELNLPFTAGFIEQFHETYKQRYGYLRRDWQIELVSVRLRARMKSPRVPMGRSATGSKEAHSPEKRQVWLEGGRVPTTLYRREDLRAGRVLNGPA